MLFLGDTNCFYFRFSHHVAFIIIYVSFTLYVQFSVTFFYECDTVTVVKDLMVVRRRMEQDIFAARFLSVHFSLYISDTDLKVNFPEENVL